MATLADVQGYITEDGELRVQLPAGLPAGQVRVRIEAVAADEETTVRRVQEENARLREILGDLVASWPDPTDNRYAEYEDMIDEIAEAFGGEPSLTQLVIEDRDEE
jgi:hypothetical protein